MTFLPIVERELRVASRRRGTYWLRFFTALISLGLFLLISSEMSRMPSSLVATVAFRTMSGAMLLICLLSGIFSTADCLSSEKRQGTAGLLFLTDLRGFDVVLGKLAAHSLHSFYGLLSMLPVLALPMLMGGVAVGEFWRTALVLALSLFLSLGVGMAVSSLLRESRQAFLLTLVVLLTVTLLIPLFTALADISPGARGSHRGFLWPSAVYAFRMAQSSMFSYGGGAQEFWTSVATLAGMTVSCLALASVVLPRAWQEKSAAGSRRRGLGWWNRLRFRSLAGRLSFRRKILSLNPFLWLTARDRLPQVLCFAVLVPGMTLWGWVYYKMSIASGTFVAFGYLQGMIFICCGINLLVKFVVSTEASRRLCDDRQSGVLELLLVTPLTVRGIVAGQRRALVRQFGLPVLLCAGLLLATYSSFQSHNPPNFNDGGIFSTIIVGNLVALFSDFMALCWIGMWDGLRSRQHHRAILRTLAKVLFIPWGGFMLMQSLFAGVRSSADARFIFGLWFALSVVNNLFWMARASRGLAGRFRFFAAHSADGGFRIPAARRRAVPYP